MDAVSQTTVVLDAAHAGVPHPALEPQPDVEPPSMHHDRGEAHAGLQHDASLLGVYGDRSGGTRHTDETPKRRLEGSRLAGKVLTQAMPPT